MEQKLKVRESGGSAEPHTALYAQSGQSVGYRGGRGRGSNRARGGPLVVVALHVVVGGLPTVSSTEAASRKVAAVF